MCESKIERGEICLEIVIEIEDRYHPCCRSTENNQSTNNIHHNTSSDLRKERRIVEINRSTLGGKNIPDRENEEYPLRKRWHSVEKLHNKRIMTSMLDSFDTYR